MTRGRKNKYQDQIYNIICNAPEGITPKDIRKYIKCHRNTITNNINNLKEEGLISGPIELKYFPISLSVKKTDFPRFFQSFKDEKVSGFGEILTEYYLKNRGIIKKDYTEDDYLEKKSSLFSALNEEEEDLYDEADNLDQIISTSLKISFGNTQKGYFFKDITNSYLYRKAIDFYIALIKSPEVFMKSESLFDLNIPLNIYLDENTLREYNFDYKRFKNTFLQAFNIDNRVINKLQKKAEIEHVMRNQRHQIIKSQLEKIKTKVLQFQGEKTQLKDYYLTMEDIFRILLKKYHFFSLESNFDFDNSVIIKIANLFHNILSEMVEAISDEERLNSIFELGLKNLIVELSKILEKETSENFGNRYRGWDEIKNKLLQIFPL
ncbi:MAG: hypothetical protein ACTSR8_04270 [Promethearchaeota archaeon]